MHCSPYRLLLYRQKTEGNITPGGYSHPPDSVFSVKSDIAERITPAFPPSGSSIFRPNRGIVPGLDAQIRESKHEGTEPGRA